MVPRGGIAVGANRYTVPGFPDFMRRHSHREFRRATRMGYRSEDSKDLKKKGLREENPNNSEGREIRSESTNHACWCPRGRTVVRPALPRHKTHRGFRLEASYLTAQP